MQSLFVRICLLVLMFSQTVSDANARPQLPLANAVILIIRHAEKPDNGPGLTSAGQRRAVAYIHYFETTQFTPGHRRPDEVIASADTDNSQRPRLTVTPISKVLRLPIDTRFRDKDFDKLAKALKVGPDGKTILICWHHGEIPSLLDALGANSDTLLPRGKWPSDVYNWVIVLRYDASGHLIPGQAKRVNERLFPGDVK